MERSVVATARGQSAHVASHPWTGVRTESQGSGSVLVTGRGDLGGVADEAAYAVLVALAGDAALVVCDLSETTGEGSSTAVDALAAAASPLRHWAGTRLVLICPTERVAAGVARRTRGSVVVTTRRAPPRDASGVHRRTLAATRRLDPDPRSSGAARALVGRACSDWGCLAQADTARIVAAELVTNAVVHARSTLSFRIAFCDFRLRLSVQDASGVLPHRRSPQYEEVTGRGLVLVAALAESWGVLPHGGGGKVTWAVMPAQVTAPGPPSVGRG